MAFKKISEYKSVKYRSFPNENGESHKKKDSEWAISWMSSLLHKYVSHNGTELMYNWEYLKTLEKYAKGEQGSRKVKEKLLRYNKETGKFKGRMKDVFQTLDILPEMIDVVISNNMKSDYKPQSMAVDEMSIKDRNMEISMAKFLIEEKTKSFLDFMGVKVDSPLTEDELSTFTSSQVDVLFNSGGIQLERERASVSVCNTAMLYSGHKEIENQTSFDAIAYGICATKSYWDYSENVAKYRYVDVKNLIVGKSKYNDFRDKTYCGEIRMMNLSEIISECPNLSGEDIRELIFTNAEHNGDFGAINEELENYCNGRNDIFDEYRVAVLDVQWLATDEEKFLQSKTSNGSIIYKKTDKDFRIKPSEAKKGKSLNRSVVIKKYEAKWVIGTDILLNFGQATNVVYKGGRGNRIPKLDYNICKTGKKSLVDRCRTLVDDINLAIAKLRSAIATLPPAPRMVIYEHALNNIKFNGILQSPKDLFSGFSEDGVLVVNGRDSNGKFINSNGGKAVEFMNTGLAEDITIFSNEAVQKINMLRQVIGLPEGLDGTAGQKYQLASTMNLAAMASSNALYPTLSIIGPLYEQTFDNSITITQAMCRSGEVEVKEIGLSDRVVNIFKLSKDFSNFDFKIKVVLSPTEAEREMLMAKISEMSAIYSQTQGAIGCSQAEFLMLYKLIKAGLIDEAMHRMASIEDLRTKANILQQQATMEANSKAQQESNIAAEQEKRNSISYSEAEKRKTIEVKEMLEGINSLKEMMLDNKSKEGGASVDESKAEQMINENKSYISNIKNQDNELLNPSQESVSEEVIMQ